MSQKEFFCKCFCKKKKNKTENDDDKQQQQQQEIELAPSGGQILKFSKKAGPKVLTPVKIITENELLAPPADFS